MTCKLMLGALCAITPIVGLILSDYGPHWKEHRRFALMTLRNFGMGKNSMEDRIHGEIKYIINTVEKSIGMSPLNFDHSFPLMPVDFMEFFLNRPPLCSIAFYLLVSFRSLHGLVLPA